MKRILIFLVVLFSFSSFTLAATEGDKTLSFPVTDQRKVITRSINPKLLLRVVKETGVNQKDLGWTVEVVRKPYRRSSRNLLYQRKMAGEHPSQVFAWHVDEQVFPNERELDVKGHPVRIRIELINPEIEGDGPDRSFVSGEVKITWGRK